MRIRIITCHDVYNFGASLQAYALQEYLRSAGHIVEIIDYKPDYLSRHFRLTAIENPQYDKCIIKFLYLLAKLPGRLYALKRKASFDRFTKSYLLLTKRQFHSNEELKEDKSDIDAYIAGSDQIWNTYFNNGRDSAFYLDFVPKGKIKISYAASFATADIIPQYREFVRKMLDRFDMVTVREKKSLPLLYSLGRTDAIAVCDPVFLLDDSSWQVLIKGYKKYPEKYMLVYDSEKSDTLKQVALEIAKNLQLKIYNVSTAKLGYADKNLRNSSPLDFLNLIIQAQYVISNSFHASAFSILFHKQFCVVNRTEKINIRMESLLSDYNLSDRLVANFSSQLLTPIDYQLIDSMLEENVKKSKLFLSSVLS